MDQTKSELAQLYRETGPLIWSYVRRRTTTHDEADEILQDTFLMVARRPEDLAKAQSQKAWLIGIARNLLLEHGRRKRRNAATALLHDPPEPERGPEDSRLETVRRAIADLPDSQREVLELRIEQDLSYAEIAVTLAIPIGTVRSRLHNAISALRETTQQRESAQRGNAQGARTRSFGG